MPNVEELKKTKYTEQMEQLAEVAASLQPNPHCRVAGCYGKKGFYGFQIIENGEGAEIKILLCCGQFRSTDYTRLREKVSEESAATRELLTVIAKEIDRQNEFVYRHTFWGGIKMAWRKLKSYFLKMS